MFPWPFTALLGFVAFDEQPKAELPAGKTARSRSRREPDFRRKQPVSVCRNLFIGLAYMEEALAAVGELEGTAVRPFVTAARAALRWQRADALQQGWAASARSAISLLILMRICHVPLLGWATLSKMTNRCRLW